MQLAYNADHELTQSISITQQGIDTTVITTDYHYDAFGRRTHKHSETKLKSRKHSSGKLLIKPVQTQKTKQQHTSYLWDGNRQLQQNTATHTHTIIYEQDSFEPVAQLIWVRDGLTAANDEPESYQENQEGWYGNNKPVIKTGVQLYHYHNDHLGTPNELTDQQGDVVWYADYEAWGNTATVEWKEQRIDNIAVSEEHLQPIRFQGQHFDTETGLHYNRFRYFDPDLGMFTTRDPIGLLGGNNVFHYAPNPTGWIDPFGLDKKRMNVQNSGHHAPSVRKSKDRSFEMKRSDKSWPTLFPTGSDLEHDHWRLHQSERTHVGPRQGDFKGTDTELFDAYKKAYSDPAIKDIKVDLRSPDGTVDLGKNIKPKTAVSRMKKWLTQQGKLCSGS